MLGNTDKSKDPLQERYETYIGKPGIFEIGNNGYTGELLTIDLKAGYLELNPSIIRVGSEIRVETEVPTIIGVNPGTPISIRPLRKGDLERIAEFHRNPNTDDKSKE